MTTVIKTNSELISSQCGNRGGIHLDVGYAGANAIAKSLGCDLAVFRGGDKIIISRWECAPGTYRAEPTGGPLHIVMCEETDSADAIQVDGDFADICLAAARACLAKRIERIRRRGESVSSLDPLDVGFDRRLHRTM